MSDFSNVLKTAIDGKGLSAAEAAATIGVSAPSLRAALSGSSFPNARSLAKYASFLGRTEEETKALIAVAKPAAGEKKPKQPKKATAAKGKPGRKPGAKSAKGKSGRKAGGKKGGSASDALASISAALKQAEALAGDELAVAVHGLGTGPRKLIESLLKTIG